MRSTLVYFIPWLMFTFSSNYSSLAHRGTNLGLGRKPDGLGSILLSEIFFFLIWVGLRSFRKQYITLSTQKSRKILQILIFFHVLRGKIMWLSGPTRLKFLPFAINLPSDTSIRSCSLPLFSVWSRPQRGGTFRTHRLCTFKLQATKIQV